jgi:carbon-monoxide dehydrogenase medium subunit
MIPHTFEYVEPSGLEEASSLLAAHGEAARVLAGGTALVNLMKLRLLAPEVVVSLRRVPGLDTIGHEPGSGLSIGAMVRVRDLERSGVVRTHAPLLADAARSVATVSVRNKATIGGSLAHADPRSDLPTALLALDATVTLTGPAGIRTLPVAAFIRGAYETEARPGEILTRVVVPPAPAGTAAYVRFSTHSAVGHPVLAVAAVVRMDGDVCAEGRLAVGAVSPAPYRAAGAEQALAGRRLSHDVIDEAARIAAGQAEPVDDASGSRAYKMHLTRVLVRDALARAARVGGVSA